MNPEGKVKEHHLPLCFIIAAEFLLNKALKTLVVKCTRSTQCPSFIETELCLENGLKVNLLCKQCILTFDLIHQDETTVEVTDVRFKSHHVFFKKK